jgi:hypothetical protein
MWHRVVLLSLLFVVGSAVSAQELVITREGSKEYHRPGCELVQGRTDILAMQRGQAEARGFKPHRECDPSYVPPAPKPVMVTVDETAKYYHRDTCSKIGKSPRQVTLDDAAKKHWPCTTCKPPIRPRKKPDLIPGL